MMALPHQKVSVHGPNWITSVEFSLFFRNFTTLSYDHLLWNIRALAYSSLVINTANATIEPSDQFMPNLSMTHIGFWRSRMYYEGREGEEEEREEITKCFKRINCKGVGFPPPLSLSSSHPAHPSHISTRGEIWPENKEAIFWRTSKCFFFFARKSASFNL